MLTLGNGGVELEELWMYETEPFKEILNRMHKLPDGTDDKHRIRNKQELTYIFFRCAIISTNPFVGIFDKAGVNEDSIEKAGLPKNWQPDFLILSAIQYWTDYQINYLPSTKILYRLYSLLHSLSSYYETKETSLKVMEAMIADHTKELEKVDDAQKSILLGKISDLNVHVKDILSEAVKAIPQIEDTLEKIKDVYDKVRGEGSSVKRLATGGNVINAREDVDKLN